MEQPTETVKTSRGQTEVTPVTMQDGRIVEFSGKRRVLKSSEEVDGKVQVRMDFRNGETRLFTIPEGLLTKFAAHGAEQKLGDCTAGLKELDDAVLAVDTLIDQLYEGKWSAARETSGMAGTSVLLRALVEVSGKSVQEIKDFLKDKSQKEKNALRNNSRIRPVVQRIEAEKAAADTSVDTTALLEEVGVAG